MDSDISPIVCDSNDNPINPERIAKLNNVLGNIENIHTPSTVTDELVIRTMNDMRKDFLTSVELLNALHTKYNNALKRIEELEKNNAKNTTLTTAPTNHTVNVQTNQNKKIFRKN